MSGKEVRENDLKAIYTIESLANLGTFQVAVRLTQHGDHTSTVSLVRGDREGRLVEVRWGSATVAIRFSHPVDEQRARIGIPDEHGCIVLSIPASHPADLRLKSIAGDEIDRLRSHKAVMLQCGACLNQLTRRDAVFRRILPLPSANWHELTDFWICHKERFPHYYIDKSIAGRPGLFLVGDTHYLVHGSDINSTAVVRRPAGKDRWALSCRVCRGDLGTVDAVCPPVSSAEHAGMPANVDASSTKHANTPANVDASSAEHAGTAANEDASSAEHTDAQSQAFESTADLEQALHNITLAEEGDSGLSYNIRKCFTVVNSLEPLAPFSRRMASFVARTLLAVSQSEVTYRLWVKPEEDPDGEPCLRIWLFNWETELVTTADCMADVARAHAGKPFTGALPNDAISDPWRSDVWTPQGSGMAVRAMKLLYHPCVEDGNAQLMAGWAGDESIHTVVFPRAVCSQLLGILEVSALWQPPHLRTLRGFRVGYLALDS